MIGGLEALWHGLLEVPYLIDSLLVGTLNGAIVALAALASAALSLLPGFPEVNALPSGVLEGMLWLFPFTQLAAVVTALIAAYVTYLGVKAILSKVGLV